MTAKTPSKRASESRARRVKNGTFRVEAFIDSRAVAYLARIKAETGKSASEQINRMLLERACQ